ncbi:hypothetical protein [Primorskyibacter flagellatus]|uniref:hypothetical protein n=1 Tax=Primorskyibacter flagellatus TaxID=1387277 RepID=UPI0015C4C841|nr:hypothetical protein [Primorskyibacter flagellatus]
MKFQPDLKALYRSRLAQWSSVIRHGLIIARQATSPDAEPASFLHSLTVIKLASITRLLITYRKRIVRRGTHLLAIAQSEDSFFATAA